MKNELNVVLDLDWTVEATSGVPGFCSGGGGPGGPPPRPILPGCGGGGCYLCQGRAVEPDEITS